MTIEDTLRGALHDEVAALETPPTAAGAALAANRRRRRGQLIGAAVVVLLLAAGGTVGGLAASRDPHRASVAVATAPTAPVPTYDASPASVERLLDALPLPPGSRVTKAVDTLDATPRYDELRARELTVPLTTDESQAWISAHGVAGLEDRGGDSEGNETTESFSHSLTQIGVTAPDAVYLSVSVTGSVAGSGTPAGTGVGPTTWRVEVIRPATVPAFAGGPAVVFPAAGSCPRSVGHLEPADDSGLDAALIPAGDPLTATVCSDGRAERLDAAGALALASEVRASSFVVAGVHGCSLALTPDPADYLIFRFADRPDVQVRVDPHCPSSIDNGVISAQPTAALLDRFYRSG